MSELPLAAASRRLRRPAGRPPKVRAVLELEAPDVGNGPVSRRLRPVLVESAVAPQASAHRAAPVSMRLPEPTVAALWPLSPRLMDVKATAVYLGISTWAVRDLVAAGELPRVRLPNRRLLFDRQDVDRLIEAWKEAP